MMMVAHGEGGVVEDGEAEAAVAESRAPWVFSPFQSPAACLREARPE